MKNTLIIVAVFLLGIVLAYLIELPEWSSSSLLQTALLALLLLLVGVGIGSEEGVDSIFKEIRVSFLFLPFLVIVGSLIGGAVASFVTQGVSGRESVAIASGMGYYSLSSILLSKLCNEQIGTMALIANLFREISTILFFPIIVRYFGKMGGIATGGATSMDTTLPLIVRYSGKEMAVVAIYTGMVITVLVPFIISVVMS